MQLNIADAALFIRVAKLGTLSAAARERNEPVSQISRAIARMESALGVRLLHRTTHGLSLTDEGDTFLNHARRMLDIAAEMEGDLTGKQAAPSGVVRLAVSAILAQQVIAPKLSGLYERYPQLQIDISADDRPVDLARDGIDIAIRTAPQIGDTLVARQIGEHTRNLYASPAYLEKFGSPQTVNDLAQHRLITNSASPTLNLWPFKKQGSNEDKTQPRASKRHQNNNEQILQVKGHTRANDTGVILTLTLEGCGIAQLNELLVAPAVAKGLLRQVLPGQNINKRIPIFAVTLPERHRLPKIRACIDYWEECFKALRSGLA